MQRRKKKEPKNSLGLAAIFFIVFLFFFGLSILFKGFFLIKNSTFDGENTYNMEFVGKKNTVYASFSPQEKTIRVVKLNSDIKPNIFIDGRIEKEFDEKNISTGLVNTIFSPSSHKGTTEIDLLRLALFARTVTQSSVEVDELQTESNVLFKV